MRFPEGKDWDVLDALLDELLDLDSSARKRRLAALTVEHPDLLEPLTRLLEGAGHTETLDAVLGEALSFLAENDSLPGQTMLGSWRLLSELGRGGMAQVFLAERADGAYQQKAAVKLLWPGMANANVLARFEQERQILATLDDSRIAHLIDGGVTDDGRPWLAMEYVQGSPVDEYCDQRRLGIEERLELFCQIAAAVGAAHRRLVVHRDIKPANILVQESSPDEGRRPESGAISASAPVSGTRDGIPPSLLLLRKNRKGSTACASRLHPGYGNPKHQVKLLDFGIAKLLDDDAMPHAAPVTRRADRLLTPEYASPEQLTESPISTASDVYQLGALLFHLLAGEPPHRRKGLSTAEFEASILAYEPPRPSTRIRTGDAATAERIARARGQTRKSLIRRLRGDLNAIVTQAMATDPEARYESADALRRDVERTLRALPVQARPARTLYQAGKFLRRHWIGASATALIVLAVVAGFAGTVWQARMAAAEARKTVEVKNFLIGLFEVSDPDTARGREITARELLNEGAVKVKQELQAEPEIQAELLGVLGQIHMKLGLFERAESLIEESLAMRIELFGRNHPATAESLHASGKLAYERGDLERADQVLSEALAIRQGPPDTGPLLIADILLDLAAVRWKQRRPDEWDTLAREVLEIRRRHLPADDPKLAEALKSAAVGYHVRGELDRAESMYREALHSFRACFGEDHLEIASALHGLGFIAMSREQWDEAESLFREALEMRLRLREGNYKEDTVQTLGALGHTNQRRGDQAEAEVIYRQAVDITRELAHRPTLAGSLYKLGEMLLEQGRAAEAEPMFFESLEIRANVFGPDHRNTLAAQVALGRARLALGDPQSAETLLRDAAERAHANLDEDHPVYFQLREALGELEERG